MVKHVETIIGVLQKVRSMPKVCTKHSSAWGSMERSPSKLKPTNEMGHRNKTGLGLAARGKSKKGIGCKKKEVKPHA